MPIKQTDYKMTNESLEIFNALTKKLYGKDIILLLLSIGQIKGKIVFQKQVFLAWKELFFCHTVDLDYGPNRYGPYSEIINNSSKFLQKKNLIKIIARKGEGTIYRITELGLNEVQKRSDELKISVTELTKKKQDWDEWDKEGIMRYTYRNYPEYTSETKLGRFKWSSQ